MSANRLITEEADAMTLTLTRRVEDLKVLVPSDEPSEYWKPDRSYARGILSRKLPKYKFLYLIIL